VRVIDVNTIVVDGARSECAESPVERTGVRVMSRVREHLDGQGVPFEPIAHQQIYTSIAEARALGIDASEVLKTVACKSWAGMRRWWSRQPVASTCVLCKPQGATGMLGWPPKRSCTRLPDVELGAVPPLALLLGGPVYVDPEVLQHETVVFAAGSQTESVKLRTADLFQFQQEQVTTAPLTRQADEDDKEWLP
jgi:prolyl-tRNA editing enzyme YbaK/EbsC (Cys-tRNA(Pro) deacylase)